MFDYTLKASHSTQYLIGIPNRYMHSPVEVISLKDLEYSAVLLAEFCLSIKPEDSWIPE